MREMLTVKSLLTEKEIDDRFNIRSNEHYIVNNIEELTVEKILDLVRMHRDEQVPRLRTLDNYYQGRNETILMREDRDSTLADYRPCHPFAAYISSFIQGYLTGVPIKVKSDNEKVDEEIKKLNEYADIDKHNSALILDLSIYGRAYELPYRVENLNKSGTYLDKLALLSPLNTFIIYDYSIEMNPLMGIRYWLETVTENESTYTRYRIHTYTDTTETEYIIGEDDRLVEEFSFNHFYGEMPVIEYSNNRFRQGDFERVLGLIDLYDAAEADTANYMTDLNNAMLVITAPDSDMDLTEAMKMKDKRILLLKSAMNEVGQYATTDAKYIYKQYDVSGVEAYKNRIQEDIHKFTNTPNMNDENFSGNTSGEAMKYKLFGLEQVTSLREGLFVASATKRYRIFFNLKSTADEFENVDMDLIRFVFTPNLPKSFAEEVDNFVKLGGRLSQETTLTLAAFVEDAKREMEKIKKEDEETPNLLNVMMKTTDNTHNHTEVNVDESK